MKKSLSTRLMYSFMTIIVIIVVGITAGISYLIADYFFEMKEHELANWLAQGYGFLTKIIDYWLLPMKTVGSPVVVMSLLTIFSTKTVL